MLGLLTVRCLGMLASVLFCGKTVVMLDNVLHCNLTGLWSVFTRVSIVVFRLWGLCLNKLPCARAKHIVLSLAVTASTVSEL